MDEMARASPAADGPMDEFDEQLGNLTSRRSSIESARRWVAAHPTLLGRVGATFTAVLRSGAVDLVHRVTILYLVHEIIKTTPAALEEWRDSMGTMLIAASDGQDAEHAKRIKKVRGVACPVASRRTQLAAQTLTPIPPALLLAPCAVRCRTTHLSTIVL